MSNAKRIRPEDLAEAFPLGEHLTEELAARNVGAPWLSENAVIGLERVIQILAGERATLSEITRISACLGVSVQCLANIQLSYMKWLKSTQKKKAK